MGRIHQRRPRRRVRRLADVRGNNSFPGGQRRAGPHAAARDREEPLEPCTRTLHVKALPGFSDEPDEVVGLMATTDEIQSMRQVIARSVHGLGATCFSPHFADPIASLGQLYKGGTRTAHFASDPPLVASASQRRRDRPGGVRHESQPHGCGRRSPHSTTLVLGSPIEPITTQDAVRIVARPDVPPSLGAGDPGHKG